MFFTVYQTLRRTVPKMGYRGVGDIKDMGLLVSFLHLLQSMNILLRRGWSARLGFSLHSTDGSHVVSQIHPDSVAERDGRLQIGDVLAKVGAGTRMVLKAGVLHGCTLP